MKRILTLAVIVGAGLIAIKASAIPSLTLTVDGNLPPGTTAYVLGAIDPDHPANPASEVDAITYLLTLGLGGSGAHGGNIVYRSQNNFGSLPAPTTVNMNGTGTSTSFIDTGYTYLVAKYDGPNGVTEVWDLAGVAAGTMINIPANAFGTDNDQYGLSGWNFFNQITTNITTVPDGGSTVALLGLALAGAGVLRRKIQK